MIDGRFDQHFLEVFSEAQAQARAGEQGPMIALVLAWAGTTLIAVALLAFS